METLLGLAVLALLLQLFPSVGREVLAALDPRNWPRTVWFAANVVVLLVLVAVRFGPQLAADWRKQQHGIGDEKARQEKQQQRKALERMQEAKRRRIY